MGCRYLGLGFLGCTLYTPRWQALLKREDLLRYLAGHGVGVQALDPFQFLGLVVVNYYVS